MGKTAPKIEEKPTTLDDALKVISLMKQAHENALSSLEGDLADAEDERLAAEERAENALQYACEELARIHIKMKAGRIREAIDDLDRVLQEHDSDGRYRTAAVAVML